MKKARFKLWIAPARPALEEGPLRNDDACKRNGTTTLFAALELLQGRVIGQCHERPRHQEFLRFPRRLDQEFPGKTPLHLVLDNYGTHKHVKVRTWLKRHSPFRLSFRAHQFQ